MCINETLNCRICARHWLWGFPQMWVTESDCGDGGHRFNAIIKLPFPQFIFGTFLMWVVGFCHVYVLIWPHMYPIYLQNASNNTLIFYTSTNNNCGICRTRVQMWRGERLQHIDGQCRLIKTQNKGHGYGSGVLLHCNWCSSDHTICMQEPSTHWMGCGVGVGYSWCR